MNVVPTRATRHLGDRMIRDATDEFGCGADAVLECLEDCMLDQVPALIGYILDRCAPAVDVEIVVEQATPVPQTVSDYAALTAATLDEVAATFPVTAAEILAPMGGRQIAEARHVTMWLLRQHGMTYPAIGAQLGRDHSTVMYGVAKVDESERLRGIAVGIQQWTASEGAA